MKRNNLLIVVVAVAAFFLLFNPIKWLTGNNTSVPRPALPPAEVNPLVQFATSSWRSPQDYVVASLATRDIVFLGEFAKISQGVTFVQSLVPRLYAAGIRRLGMEYGLADDQQQIDALVTAPTWDEAKARALMFDWVVTWGYQEYIDIYKAAWQVNSRRPAGADPFRIIALSPRQDWSVLTAQADLSDPAKIAALYAQEGSPDAHMAAVIQKQFLQTGQKAVVYTGTQHALTRYRSVDYEKNAAKLGLPETRRAGTIVAAAAPGRVMTIEIHAPWPDATNKVGLGYPAGGLIDAMIDALPADKRSGGWNLAGTPLGALSIKGSVYETPSATTLADVFDGYIVLGPLHDYTVVTAITDFIQAKDADRATQQFPGVKPAPMTLEQVQASIAQDVDAVQKALAQLR
jgi:hypothetical protein